MKKNTILQFSSSNQIYSFLIALLLFFFCFAPKSSGLFIVLLALCTIYLGVKKELKFYFSPINLILLSIYLAYLFGLFFCENHVQGMKYVEYKLVLLIFPILFSFKLKEGLNLKIIFSGLIFGVMLTSFLGLYNSWKIFKVSDDFNNSFGSSSFSYIHHPTYFSTFLLISLAFSIYGLIQKWRFFSYYSVGIFAVFNLMMQFFCFSFANILFVVLLFVFLIFKFLYSKFNKKSLLFGLLITPFFLFLIYKSNIHIQIEIDGVANILKEYINNPKQILNKKESEITGNDARLIMWTATFEEILENPFGVGTGDVDFYLSKRLNSYNLAAFAKKEYNPHNQFLQITLEIGFLALLLFLSLFVFGLRHAYKNKNWILALILLNLFFNSLFESMLQQQSGIIFYVLLIVLLYNHFPKPTEIIGRIKK